MKLTELKRSFKYLGQLGVVTVVNVNALHSPALVFLYCFPRSTLARRVCEGGGFTSDEVLAWMDSLFMSPTSTGKAQASRLRNSYGSSEFPGISQNGEINESVDLELVPVPEFDVVTDGVCVSARGSRFEPSAPGQGGLTQGEIRVRHRNASLKFEYWKNPQATAAAFREGWYYTGDVGELNPAKTGPDGRPTLRIVDRVTGMLELYVDGDSKWLEQALLEAAMSTSFAVEALCLVADRNEDRALAVTHPRLSFMVDVLDQAQASAWLEHVQNHAGCAVESVAAGVELVDRLVGTARSQLVSHLTDLPTVAAAVHSSIVAAAQSYFLAAKGRLMEAWEVPGAVLLECERWTMENNFLTPTGKPRREKITSKFMAQMEVTYSALSSAAGVPGSPVSDTDTSILATSARSTRQVQVVLPSVLDIKVQLCDPFAAALESIAADIGPALAAQSGKALGWGGYIKQNESDLPCYPDSTRKDYLGFRIEAATEQHTRELEELLEVMREETRRRRECTTQWSADVRELRAAAAARAQCVLEEHTAICNSELDIFLDRVRDVLAAGSAAQTVAELLSPLLVALTDRLVAVRQEYEKVGAIEENPAQVASFSAYR